ncbi:piggyBac transposable element-derived protein 4-like [Macrosteles quadrilineatus]|uniref:piggyBac transposable element-derived protein 4-like n=1 Tax=Macrosteles quadrilineatus TaxID=74068 RepID=UPI0023E100E7|nr:piggyBac transposable element-derived protein 4-like [Macrosteles quadrilineatus]
MSNRFDEIFSSEIDRLLDENSESEIDSDNESESGDELVNIALEDFRSDIEDESVSLEEVGCNGSVSFIDDLGLDVTEENDLPQPMLGLEIGLPVTEENELPQPMLGLGVTEDLSQPMDIEVGLGGEGERGQARKLGDNPSAFQCLEAFLGEEFFAMVCQETNDYAATQLAKPNRRKKFDDDKWQPLTIPELKAYFALYILMGQVRKPTIKMYWTSRKILETPIYAEVMTYQRFKLISRFLHFADEEFAEQGDKLKKLRPVISYMQTKFMHTYTMNQTLAIDESLVKLRARLSYVQFNPKKRARFGIKVYKLCESASGYCGDFKIYTGDDKAPNIPASEAVVMQLADSVLDLGHILYIDNWYSSPGLCKRVLERKTHVVGTVNLERINMPEEFDSANLEIGQAIRRSKDGILAVKWKDRKDVHVLSTIHAGIEMTVDKVIQRKGIVSEVIKPKSVIEYNKGMLGVDVQDQMLASHPIMRRTIKSYKKTVFLSDGHGNF